MLMSSQANRYAHQLLDARAQVQLIPPLSANGPLSVADGYDIAKSMIDIRTAQGETMIGRKVGFTNRKIWPKYGVSEPIRTPIWTPIFDETVRFTEDNRGIQSLDGALQPRIGPEVVFKLHRTPSPDATLAELAECIEWMAHSVEIVQCHHPEWKVTIADCTADNGLHGRLVVGSPMPMQNPDELPTLEARLYKGSELKDRGVGANVLGSPLIELGYLVELLRKQPEADPLRAGEVISTGVITDAHPVAPAETWRTQISGVPLEGLNITFR